MSASIMTVCKLVYDHATEEWIVRASTHHNVRVPAADYFTTDKADAWGTALALLDASKSAGSIVEVDQQRQLAWWTPKGGQV